MMTGWWGRDPLTESQRSRRRREYTLGHSVDRERQEIRGRRERERIVGDKRVAWEGMITQDGEVGVECSCTQYSEVGGNGKRHWLTQKRTEGG